MHISFSVEKFILCGLVHLCSVFSSLGNTSKFERRTHLRSNVKVWCSIVQKQKEYPKFNLEKKIIHNAKTEVPHGTQREQTQKGNEQYEKCSVCCENE